jgi:hypothetical protein
VQLGGKQHDVEAAEASAAEDSAADEGGGMKMRLLDIAKKSREQEGSVVHKPAAPVRRKWSCWGSPVVYKWQKGFTFKAFESSDVSDHQIAGYLKTMTDPYDIYNGNWPIFYWECVCSA